MRTYTASEYNKELIERVAIGRSKHLRIYDLEFLSKHEGLKFLPRTGTGRRLTEYFRHLNEKDLIEICMKYPDSKYYTEVPDECKFMEL